MEPLNEILERVTPRRQLTSNHPTYQGTFSPSSRATQPSQPPTKHQQSPQVTYQRQKYPYSEQPDHVTANPHRSQDRLGVSWSAGQESTPHRESGRYQTSPLQRSENRVPSYRQAQPPTGRMLSQAQQEASSPQPSEPIQPLLPSATNKTGNYHRADDSIPNFYADVIDEWDEGEEDVDQEGMRYGDWESDELEPVYKRPALEILPNPRTYHPAQLQETKPPRRALTGRPTRDLHTPDTHTPVGMPTSSAQLPRSTTHTQDIRQYQRVTQPLNPKIISGLERERTLRPSDIQRASSGKITPSKPSHGRVSPTHQFPEPLPVAIMPTKTATCPRCQGAGYLRANVAFGHPHFGKAIACECKEAERRTKRRQQLREMSNLDAFRNQNFQTFNARVPGVQEAYKATMAFAEKPEGWLLLVGPNGCGKTHLAAAIANQALDSGAVVLFEPVPDLLDHLRAAFAPSSNEVYDQLFAKMREAEVLILDDLGAQQSSPWANEKLFQLLNYRYNMGMPTVITANLKGIQGVDERIRSRLSDTGLVVTIHMDRAYDYRPKRPKRCS